MFFRKKQDGLEKVYAKELRKRDAEIAELIRKNELLLKTAMRQSAAADEYREYALRLEKHVRQLEEEIKKLRRAKH